MSEDKTLTKIPHFDGHYDHWSELMENLLRAKGLWSLVEIGFTEPIEGTILTEAQREQFDDARLKDHQVKHYLFQAIDRTVFEQILDRRTAKSVWDSLKRKFGGNLKVKKSLLNALRREFEVLEMKKDETITDYFARYECPKWKNEANYAELDEEDELLLMAYVELHEAKRSDAWFLDSGCSNHMCGNKSMFSSLDTTFTHSVKLGNNTRMKVSGKGTVKLILQGNCYTIGEVYWAPELKNNLMSVGQLQEKGVAVLFKNGVCSIYHPQKGKMAESIMSANRMFILLAESSITTHEGRCLQVSNSDQSILWHYRYGDLSYKGLRILQQKHGGRFAANC
ncbi:hypothetical protein GH714_012165 [Hevea brasiliensis]|uniref:Retrovirus-related Pol polyprotein from transposon TNT 1-94-like beta-barrel domain-containing protein n=1 Tax=Hevea brasiliensis TaxID=3981 RepID=A0A6A6N3E8_HEVBR|nr:hypothetical protein GH714_012165 [Hevea brasiliensis]